MLQFYYGRFSYGNLYVVPGQPQQPQPVANPAGAAKVDKQSNNNNKHA